MSIIEVILYLQCISIWAAPFCIWSTFVYLKRFCVCTVFLYLQCILIFEAYLCIWSISVSALHLCILCAFVYLKCVCVFEARLRIWRAFLYLHCIYVYAAHLPLSATVPYTIALLFCFTLICILINWGEYSQICSMKLHSSLVNILCIHIFVIYKICQVVVYSIFHSLHRQSVEISNIRKQTSRQ